MKKILVLGLSLLMAVSMAACGKEEEPEEIYPEHNYAQNDIVEKPEETTDTSTATPTQIVLDEPPEEEEEVWEHLEIVPQEMVYNVTDDVNMNEVRDMTTISIDGKLTAFPCDYEYLSEKFGTFYIEEVGKYLIKTDVTGDEVGTYFEVHATPTTGEGTIIFKFKSDTETKLSNMECVGYKLQAGNNSGDKLMTCALPNWINFGSSIESIREQFGQNTKSGSYSKKGSFMLYYSFEDYDINFVGYDDGLYIIDVTYNN